MRKTKITIEYCSQCKFLLRSAFIAQELLTTFADELESVSLKPSETIGQFNIYFNKKLLFDHKKEGGFPEIIILKQMVQERVNPKKNIRYADKH